MNENQNENLAALHDIKRMMEQSSRFVSLSGLSGIAVGCCALVASFLAGNVLYKANGSKLISYIDNALAGNQSALDLLQNELSIIALVTLVVSLSLAFLFTYLRSKKHQIPLWGSSAKRLTINMAIPLMVGGIFILRLLEMGHYSLLSPTCLLFYGLALVNASKYTLGEIRYLGYAQLLIGTINLFTIGYGLYCWAIGFGIMHIVYGVYMWNKYEKA